ncbi:potassium channel family protein [Gordonia alkanivorans]|uniref:potassium channel family protein n=1 Tax=Gordonia alkanivorans TaxID=84096 RepID=UPI0024479AC2|nr:potassium channel family protein [Gordonia alkanivorans]MDH3006412.1 potassium channel family protein [Gordonia alkanivorans]MDH3041430.1 potassium channel family protein [Gordonia alkanivorans]MDH3043963.1 potassium channel family protein [Gordonia alkanivorans]
MQQTGLGVINVPERAQNPVRAIGIRVAIAVGVISIATAVVYVDRDAYSHALDAPLTLLDCLYYVTVSLSTTGYGDIAPMTPGARVVNVLVVTPLRVLFLVVLIGTTLEVLTERSRRAWRIQRWRHNLRDHHVIVGFGTKGRSAARALIDAGVDTASLVVVDSDPNALDAAESLNLVAVRGDATRSEVLKLAEAGAARAILIAVHSDATAVLITLTARQLSPGANIAGVVRDAQNVSLLRRSGADTVVVSAATAGRLMGIATRTPHVVEVVDDLLTPGTRLSMVERPEDR